MKEEITEATALEHLKVLLAQGNAAQLIKVGKIYLRLFPQAPQLHGMLSIAYQQLGKKEEGLKHSQESIALDPMDHYCLYVHAKALIALGRSSEAIVFLDKAISLEPLQASYLGLKAAYLLEHGKVTEAHELVNEALAIAPEHSSCLNLKSLCLQLLPEAQEEQIQGFQMNASGFFTMAYKAYLAGKPEEAILYSRESLNINPNNEYARNLLVEATKMKFPPYRKYILHHTNMAFGKSAAPGIFEKLFWGALYFIYVLLIFTEFCVSETGIDRFLLVSFPFMLFALVIVVVRTFFPLSNLLVAHKKELWELLPAVKKRNTKVVSIGLLLSLLLLGAALFLHWEELFLLSALLLFPVLVFSSKVDGLLESWPDLLFAGAIAALVVFYFTQLLKFKVSIGFYLVLVYLYVYVSTRRIRKSV